MDTPHSIFCRTQGRTSGDALLLSWMWKFFFLCSCPRLRPIRSWRRRFSSSLRGRFKLASSSTILIARFVSYSAKCPFLSAYSTTLANTTRVTSSASAAIPSPSREGHPATRGDRRLRHLLRASEVTARVDRGFVHQPRGRQIPLACGRPHSQHVEGSTPVACATEVDVRRQTAVRSRVCPRC